MINTNIKEKLDVIETIAEKYNETIYSGVTIKEINFFKHWWLQNCNQLTIPNGYLGIVYIIDGFDFDGLSFYSINYDKENNLYESNEIYWENENLKEYLFIGEDSISWYCISFNTEKYYILDKPSGSVIDEFFQFDDLLMTAFESIS